MEFFAYLVVIAIWAALIGFALFPTVFGYRRNGGKGAFWGFMFGWLYVAYVLISRPAVPVAWVENTEGWDLDAR